MEGIKIHTPAFNYSPYMTRRVGLHNYYQPSQLSIFDQNGYSLTELEYKHALVNSLKLDQHQKNIWSVRKPWMESSAVYGAHFNHCCVFERWGFAGEALECLHRAVEDNPLLWKLIKLKPKWGIDVSIDWVDNQGNVFEVYHMEWDSFDLCEVIDMAERTERLVMMSDWDDIAKRMWSHKDEWKTLDYNEASDWKCNFIGAPKERYKVGIWDSE